MVVARMLSSQLPVFVFGGDIHNVHSHQIRFTMAAMVAVRRIPFCNVPVTCIPGNFSMHEESLTRALLSQVIAVAVANQAVTVQKIEVSCGGLSGVEPLLLQEAFQRIQTEYECCRNAVLSIHDPGLPAQCRVCRATFQIQDFRFRCTVCSSSDLQILDGDCLKLLNVSLQLPTDEISKPISGTVL